jgi:hypothetical protein
MESLGLEKTNTKMGKETREKRYRRNESRVI